jgi:outer membrane protein OmpA-like peptidoglycan-associated protein
MRVSALISGLIFISASFQAFAQGKFESESFIAYCLWDQQVTNYTESSLHISGNSERIKESKYSLPQGNGPNGIWLRLEPNVNGEFGFEISTESDIEFKYYLYKAKRDSKCDDILNGTVLPIKTDSFSFEAKNASIVTDSKAPYTLKSLFESKAMDVYYLLICTNANTQETLKIKYYRIGDVVNLDDMTKDYRTNPKFKTLSVRVRDNETGEAVEANLTISGIILDDRLFQGSDFKFDARPSKGIELFANAKGYFMNIQQLKIKPSEDSEILVKLEKLAPGKKLTIHGLGFQQNSIAFSPSSKIALERLLDFMVLNNEIKIEIRGHVNALSNDTQKRAIKISNNRAKEVYKYLVKNGISKSRLTCKGFGSTEMIFPNPMNVEQEDANCRVEIMIIA